MTNEQVLTAGMAKVREIADKAIVESLSELAEKSIEHVLTITRGYTHRTFNLNDSYGYGIYHNGDQVKKWMNKPEATKPDAKGGKGSQMGSEFLDRFASESPKPWGLVVVAGEFYAADVQILHNLDVLTGAFQYTRENFLADFKRIN